MTPNPYGKYMAGEDVVASLEQVPRRIADICRRWSPAAFGRSYHPGKWSGRTLLTHLAQMEMVFATRLRFALADDGYTVQSFDQDPWMAAEHDADGLAALEAYLALRRLNLGLARRLTPDQRRRTCAHPDFGTIDVEWLLVQVAGHERHHLPQLEQIDPS
jgi:hypothetical protein